MNKHLKHISLLLILFTFGCTNKNDLIGKRLYILGGDATNAKFIKHLTEVELYFKDDKKVYMTATVRYGKKIKDIDTATREYDYTYVDKVLSIPKYGFENQKLYESNKLYNNEAEIFLYKSSFLSLSVEEKRDRLKEIYGKGWMVLLKLLRVEEIIRDLDNDASNPNNNIEQPKFDVETILNTTNAEQLYSYYGKENIKREKHYGIEGQDLGYKYILFPKSPKEVIVAFIDGKTYIIVEKETTLKLPYGIYVGMPLEKLLKVNREHITFSGFEWDFGGYVTSFNNGTLDDKGIVLNLNTGENYDEETYLNFLGSNDFNTSDADIEFLKLEVGEIRIFKP